jgi:hypothetical protein
MVYTPFKETQQLSKNLMIQTLSCKAEKSSDSQEARHFMEPEDSLPRSHDTTISPFLSQMNRVRIILSFYFKMHMSIKAHMCLGLPNSLFPLVIPINTLNEFLFYTIVVHTVPISSFSI